MDPNNTHPGTVILESGRPAAVERLISDQARPADAVLPAPTFHAAAR